MFLSEIANRGNAPVLEKVLAFAEARQRVLAENVANLDVPGFKTKQLDVEAFQTALRRAIDERGDDPHRALRLPENEQIRVDERGHLVVMPAEHPTENILFHDRSNPRIEELMAQVAESIMTYNVATQLLKDHFDGLKTAIRGQV